MAEHIYKNLDGQDFMVILLSDYDEWAEYSGNPEDPYPMATDKNVIEFWRQHKDMDHPLIFCHGDKELTFIQESFAQMGYDNVHARFFFDLHEELIPVGYQYCLRYNYNGGQDLIILYRNPYNGESWYTAT